MGTPVRRGERCELAVGNEQPGWLSPVHENTRLGGQICSNAHKIAVHCPGLGLDEVVAHRVAKCKGVEDILPVAAADDEGASNSQLILHEGVFARVPWVEMNVLNTTDVVSGVNEYPDVQRLPLHTGDVMSWRFYSGNAVERVQKFDIGDSSVVADEGESPGVGHGECGALLLHMPHTKPTHRPVSENSDEGSRRLISTSTSGHEN
mmetsp:Transcript_2585/g.6827  ORF Transcript_2585/g.6827 Transcript_2585/m.6827 type:complete len:206 (+) Transcript_2585:457-1074(+)